MFSLKNTFPANSSFRAFRQWRAYVYVTTLCRRYDVQKKQNGGRSPIENKQIAYVLETRISFLQWQPKKLNMCTIVTSSDMTSFVYIGDEKHHLSKWLGKEKKWPPA